MKYFDFVKFTLYNEYWYINCLTKGNFNDEGTIVSKFILPKKKEKEFKNQLGNFHYNNLGIIPDEILQKVSSSLPIEEVIDFLHNNYLEVLTLIEKTKVHNIAVISNFSDEVSELLMQIDRIWICNPEPLTVNENGELKVVFDASAGYQTSLVFKNAEISQEVNFEFEDINSYEYSKENEFYTLDIATSNDIVTIKFSDVERVQEFFDYSSSLINPTTPKDFYPWTIVANILNELKLLESKFGAERLNNKEKVFLPLVNFAPIMFQYSLFDIAEHDRNIKSIEFFETLVKEHNVEYLIPLLNQLKQCTDKSKLLHLTRKVSLALFDKRCEPLWRRIYQDLKDAASVYPLKNEINKYDLETERKRITKFLLSQDYTGKYPFFKKLTSLKGIKMLANLTNTYFVGHEKNMASYIFCEESFLYDDRLFISYLCGTIFLKPKQLDKFDQLDAYSAFFVDKGRRFTSIVRQSVYDFDDNMIVKPDISIALIAAKKASVQRLTKEENNKIMSADNTSILTIIIACMVFGSFLFGLAMTIAMMVITFILGVTENQSIELIMEFIKTFPWHWVFLGSGLPFGIILGMFTIIARKRK
ncbi:MAG: DUF3878 family protein [Eubacteriales bacterium]|nr:DUF3878 family protein [Eubacteriales bacterium]